MNHTTETDDRLHKLHASTRNALEDLRSFLGAIDPTDDGADGARYAAWEDALASAINAREDHRG